MHLHYGTCIDVKV